MAGARLSVAGALEAVVTAMLLGILPGVASAWAGRRVEWFALRTTETLMVLPFTVFAIAVVGTLGNGLHQSMIALGVILSPLYFRVTRAVALGLRQAQYVEAAELMGASQWWILRRHIWSKVMPTLAVTTAQAIGTALLVVASLTFLGLGVAPPAPTWGGMLASDLGYLSQQPWAPFYPGLIIMITVGSLNLLADAIRDAGPDDVRRGWRRSLAVAAGSGLIGPMVDTRAEDPTSEIRSLTAQPTTRRKVLMPPSPQPEPDGAESTLAVERLGVNVGREHRAAVHDVSFAIRRGESVGLVGESGSGKTLTCRAILGLLPAGCDISGGRIAIGSGPDAVELVGARRKQWNRVRGVTSRRRLPGPGVVPEPVADRGPPARASSCGSSAG